MSHETEQKMRCERTFLHGFHVVCPTTSHSVGWRHEPDHGGDTPSTGNGQHALTSPLPQPYSTFDCKLHLMLRLRRCAKTAAIKCGVVANLSEGPGGFS
jgi:hypothetical protein